MKITVGLGSIDDYLSYTEAGADEFFCGYVPYEWMEGGGLIYPLNRREVLYYNVQIGSESEMEILAELVRQKKKPVTVALNGLFYAPHQYSMIAKLITRLFSIGFSSFIVGDMALLVFLKQTIKLPITIHVSGELSETNHLMIDEMRLLDAKRIIFHRKVTPTEMKSCIEYQKKLHLDEPMEYEAFALNEMCHFTGAFCSSLHCDELAPSCRLPYRLIKLGEKKNSNILAKKRTTNMNIDNTQSLNSIDEPEEEPELFDDEYLLGRSGCGLCALRKLQDAGITHLKLVSRGNYTADTIEDIRRLKKALMILEKTPDEVTYQKQMRKALFQKGCSHNCYYIMTDKSQLLDH